MQVHIVMAYKKQTCGFIVGVFASRNAANACVETTRAERPTLAFLIHSEEVIDKED